MAALWQIRQPCDWQTANMVFTLVKGLDISHANSNLIASGEKLVTQSAGNLQARAICKRTAHVMLSICTIEIKYKEPFVLYDRNKI